MASKNEYREALKGTGPIPPAQGIYNESSTQKAVLGTRLEFNDGRVFRYAKNGATALVAGKLVKVGAIAHVTNVAVATAATTVINPHLVTVGTTSACTSAEEGYLQVNDAAGEGRQYKIRLTAASIATATETDVTMYDPINYDLTTSSEVTLLYNQYEQCEVATLGTDIILGVSPIPVTAEYYFWLQTWGITNVLQGGATTAGVMVSTETSSGGVSISYGDTTPCLGTQMLVGVDGEYKPVWLRITP